MKNITVIGAGIIGIACASYLQRDGHAVTVVASRGPGEDCSFGNSGLLSPGSVVPPALPGAWRNIPRWLLDPLGPLAIRWSYAPRLAAVACRAGLRACGERARARYRARSPRCTPRCSRTTRRCWRMPAQRISFCVPGSCTSPGRTAQPPAPRSRKRCAPPPAYAPSFFPGDAAREMEPALGRQYRSALYFPDNGHSVNSFQLVRKLAAQFQHDRRHPAQRTVTGFEMSDRGPRRLLTDGGPLPVETLVIAAGAWSHRLTAQLGTRVPLEAERGYHLMLPRPGVALRMPLVDRDHNFTMTPMDCGLRLGGTAEFAGVDAPPDYRRARILLEHARRALPGLNGEGATEWMGCRPSLPDGLPIIDRSPHFANVFFAFGHAHFGLTEAPTTGKLIAEMIGGRPPRSIPRPTGLRGSYSGLPVSRSRLSSQVSRSPAFAREV